MTKVRLTKNAQKDLDNIRHDWKRAVRSIYALEENPEKGHRLKGELAGARSLEFSLKGGGAYRAVYLIHKDVVCIVFVVGPHENIYREAARRLHSLRKTNLDHFIE